MNIGIGIDTGGTYTDAVAYDFDTGAILGKAKARTTPDQLVRGILRALDALPQAYVEAAQVIGLSTTLATNACVQDRGGRAKLLFFGGNRKVIDRYGAEYGLPPSKEMYLQDSPAGQRAGEAPPVDWDLFARSLENGLDELDGVGIVEMNAVHNSAVVEKKAKEMLLTRHDLPVVCGHELFNELNSLQRGASALLNARLVPVIRSFLTAVREALTARGVDAPVVIVRSDGGLMSEEFAHTRPVETLLCGPAASVLGSARLTEEPDCIVVDMGGTTTDIALVHNRVPVRVVDGVRVGKWKTFVSGLYVHTFGLGGDTAIHYDNGQLLLEDYRVIPLCVAAQDHPEILDTLRALALGNVRHTKPLHEHFVLMRDIEDSPRYTAEEKAFCRALAAGPISLREAGRIIPGQDLYNLQVTTRLLRDGVIEVCGLTPTDIMHVRGDFTSFSVEAAQLACGFVAGNLGLSVDALGEAVYDRIKRRMYVHIVRALLAHQDPHYRHGIGPETDRLIDRCYDRAKAGEAPGLLALQFRTDYVLTGVGAPIRVFLQDVARLLGTRAVTPEHYEVANALGAVVGQVVATSTVDIRPVFDEVDPDAYRVFGSSATKGFRTKEAAEAFALEDAKAAAHAEAVRRGAKGEVSVTSTVRDHEAQARHSTVYLGTRVTAQAIGSIGHIG